MSEIAFLVGPNECLSGFSARVVVVGVGLTVPIVASFTVRVTVGGREVPPTVSSLKGKKASLNFKYSQNVYILQAACCVPASIAFGHPNADLSGIFLKPLRAWDYPNNCLLSPKGDACWYCE